MCICCQQVLLHLVGIQCPPWWLETLDGGLSQMHFKNLRRWGICLLSIFWVWRWWLGIGGFDSHKMCLFGDTSLTMYHPCRCQIKLEEWPLKAHIISLEGGKKDLFNTTHLIHGFGTHCQKYHLLCGYWGRWGGVHLVYNYGSMCEQRVYIGGLIFYEGFFLGSFDYVSFLMLTFMWGLISI